MVAPQREKLPQPAERLGERLFSAPSAPARLLAGRVSAVDFGFRRKKNTRGEIPGVFGTSRQGVQQARLLLGRKSLRWCLTGLFRIWWLDSIAQASELPDHLPSTPLLRLCVDGGTSFFVTDFLMQD